MNTLVLRCLTLIALASSTGVSSRVKMVNDLVKLGSGSESFTPQIITVLSESWRANEIDTVLDGALATLQSTKLTPAHTKLLFGFVAAALAEKNYDSGALAETGVMGRLQSIHDRLDCQDCATPVENIRDLYFRGMPASLDWWKAEDSLGSVMSAAAGMRALLRTLGARAISQKKYNDASIMFQAALKLVPSPDFEAANGLLGVYYAQQNLDALRSLDNDVRRMTQEQPKTGTDWEALYKYHRTVGGLYVAQRQWVDATDPGTGALTHLRQASNAFDQTNELRRQSDQPALRDPALYDVLGQAYAAHGQTANSIRSLVQSAEQWVDIGDKVKAVAELESVPFQYVPDGIVDRYASVLGNSVTISTAAKLPSKTDSLRGMLSIVAKPKNAADKERALAILRNDYGIMNVKVDNDGMHGDASLLTGEVIAFKLAVPSPPFKSK